MLDWSGLAAIDPRHLAPLARQLTRAEAADAINAVAGPGRPTLRQRGGQAGIAVLAVHGVISHRASIFSTLFGGTTLDLLTAELEACRQDSDIQGVVLHVDSPGGGVYGVDECAAAIAALASRKPVHGFISGLGASAAYWLASACTRLTAAPSAEVGSIGVYSVHLDHSGELKKLGIVPTIIKAGDHKAEGHPYGPLSPADQAAMQERIDTYHSLFTRRVAKGRGVTVDVVRNTYGKGRVLAASAARSAGMVDGIGTFEDALSKLRAALPRTTMPPSEAHLRAELDELAAGVAHRVTRYESDEMLRLRLKLAQVGH